MRVLILLILSFSLPYIYQQANATKYTDDCGRAYITVSSDSIIDLKMACEGIERAITFFKGFGITTNEPIIITFEDYVEVALLGTKGEVVGYERVYGLYDKSSKIITICSWGTECLKGRKVFCYLPTTQEFHTSIIAHEVAHRIHHIITDKQKVFMAHGTSEYLAYITQISTMDSFAQDQVLKLWPGQSLDHVQQINSMVWALSPHAFGVLAFRFHTHNPQVLENILAGNFVDPDQGLDVLIYVFRSFDNSVGSYEIHQLVTPF